MFANFQINEPEIKCSLAETHVTKVLPTCTDLLETTYCEVPASSGKNSDSQVLEFVYKGSPSIYPALHDSQIYLICKLLNEDGSALKEADDVGPVNFLGKLE